MFNLKELLGCPYGFYDYIWIDAILIKETRKAILIMFDDRKIWLPKAWIIVIARRANGPTKQSQLPELTSIKISLYHWAKEIYMNKNSLQE